MNQCKSVQKYFLNKGKRTSVKGIKHEDKKTFWNKIWNNKTTWHLLAYGFIKTTISDNYPEVVDILKRLGVNMVYKNYASKVENTLNPTMKAFERQHIETRSFLLDTELNYIFMIVNFQLNVMRRVIRIATLYMNLKDKKQLKKKLFCNFITMDSDDPEFDILT